MVGKEIVSKNFSIIKVDIFLLLGKVLKEFKSIMDWANVEIG